MERVHQFLGGKTSIWDCAAKRMPSWAAIISAWKSPIVCEMFPAPAFATSLFLMTAPPSPSPPRFSFECSINIDFHDTCWRPNPFLDHLVTERWNSIELLPLSPSHTISFHHWYNRTHAFICCLPVPTIYESNPQMMGLRQIGSNLFQSQCPTFLHSFFTNLNYKNRWAPSSSNLLHMTHLASSSIPLLFRFIRTARLLCAKRLRKCLIFPGHFRDQIPFQA